MKVIATVADGVVLVQMTHRELARLTGRAYETEMQDRLRREDAFRVGAEYNVNECWDRIQKQQEAAQKLDSVSKTLSALADLVKQTEGALVQATQPNAEGGAV